MRIVAAIDEGRNETSSMAIRDLIDGGQYPKLRPRLYGSRHLDRVKKQARTKEKISDLD